MSEIILRAEHIDKSFIGVHALKDVSVEIRSGEIRCLAGENGSAKPASKSAETKAAEYTSSNTSGSDPVTAGWEAKAKADAEKNVKDTNWMYCSHASASTLAFCITFSNRARACGMFSLSPLSVTLMLRAPTLML